jgi:hypothetical protein
VFVVFQREVISRFFPSIVTFADVVDLLAPPRGEIDFTHKASLFLDHNGPVGFVEFQRVHEFTPKLFYQICRLLYGTKITDLKQENQYFAARGFAFDNFGHAACKILF